MEKASPFGVKVSEEGYRGNHQVRLDLARQLKNKYRLRVDDPLAYLLEDMASVPGLVLVLFSHNPVTGKRIARVLEGAERNQSWERMFSRQTIKDIVDDSFTYSVAERQPKGFISLQKKVGHFRSTRAKEGAGTQSNFSDFESIRFAEANVWEIQNKAAQLISGIMSNPGTIIIRDMTTDVIDVHGRGARVGNIGSLISSRFMGFVDTKLYIDPRKVA